MEKKNILARARAGLQDPFGVMVLVALMYLIKSTAKVAIGTYIHSPMIAGDGFHNVADLLQAVAVMAVLYVAKLPSSEEYPFGRKNIEFFTSLIIGGGLLYMALQFAFTSFIGLLAAWPAADHAARSVLDLPAFHPLVMEPATFPFVVAITGGSVIMSLLVGRYTIKVGKARGHASLIADGEETKSDARVEIVTLVGVLVEYIFHLPLVEYPLGLLVAFIIGHTGWELFHDAWKVLLQHSIGLDHEARIKEACTAVPGVREASELKTFRVGHTAVCMVTVISKHSAQALYHVKYGVEHAIRAYILSQEDFKECEIHLKVKGPDPQRHRIAFALTHLQMPEDENSQVHSGMHMTLGYGDCAVVAPSLDKATHFLVCDIECGSIVRTKEEPMPADPIAYLKDKRVSRLYLFGQQRHLAAGTIGGIATAAATSYHPDAYGLGHKL